MVEQKYIDYWRDRQAKESARFELLAKQAWLDVEEITKLLTTEFGATQIIVFGSLIEVDRFDDESDIDVAAKGIPPAEFFTAMAAANRVSRHWIDLKPIEAMDAHFLQKITRLGKCVYEKS